MSQSNIKNADLPAFAAITGDKDHGYIQEGLTKREYFAALAMQGMLANPECLRIIQMVEHPEEFLSVAAVEQADAVLKQLEKKPE